VTIGTKERYDPRMDRFDDVEVRVVDEPIAPPPPRSRRRFGNAALALIAAGALTGSLAAGASALTSTAQAPTRASDAQHRLVEGKARWDKRGLCREKRERAVDY
jgi:hypothetical protein